jgi:hypothetical protein
MQEPGKGHQPADQVIDRFIAPHRLGEQDAAVIAGSEPGELAAIGILEGLAFGVGAIEVALDLGGIDGGIEIGEVPFRQRAEIGLLGGLGGGGR